MEKDNGLTPNHLNAICSDLLGQPAGTVIRERVILEAKRLLVNPESSVAAVADMLNFKDNSYFSKFFKKYTAPRLKRFATRLRSNRKSAQARNLKPMRISLSIPLF